MNAMNAFSPDGFQDALAKVNALHAQAERILTPCGEGRMVWHCWGGGRTIVLLHGGAGSWRHWARNVPVLAERYRVVAPDMPGLGDSDMPPLPWTLDVSAGVVAEGLERIVPSGESFDLVGFSAGSMVAGLAAARLEQRCRSLILVGAGGLDTERSPIVLEKVRSKQGAERWNAHAVNLARLMFSDPAKIDAQAMAIQEWNTVHARVNSVGYADSAVLRDALVGSRMPLKAIWGSDDAPARTTLEERCNTLRRVRPDVEIRIIPQAGHWVSYEAAGTFNDMLLAMLDEAG